METARRMAIDHGSRIKVTVSGSSARLSVEGVDWLPVPEAAKRLAEAGLGSTRGNLRKQLVEVDDSVADRAAAEGRHWRIPARRRNGPRSNWVAISGPGLEDFIAKRKQGVWPQPASVSRIEHQL
jgi:hypothetical protein